MRAFDESGHLPVGIHACSIDEFAELVGFNEHRRRLWSQFASFLAWPVLSQKFVGAYIGGGFVSTKATPEDIDVVLESAHPYGPEAFAHVAPFFAVRLERILHLYGVHLQFWMHGAPAGLSDYRVFFQYGRPHDFVATQNPSRGIIRLDLTPPGVMETLRRHLRAEFAPPGPSRAASLFRKEADKLSGLKGQLARVGLDSPQMMILSDRQGRIEWVNPRFAEACGYSLEEARGQKPGEFLQGPESDAATVQLLRQAVSSSRHCDCRIVNYRKDGDPYLVHIALEPIFGVNGLEGFVAIEEDLGSLKSSGNDGQAAA